MMHVESSCFNHCGVYLKAEVMGDVERREFCIDVGIDDGQQVNSSEGEDAEVSEPAVGVLLTLEDSLESLFFANDAIVGRQHLLVAFRVGVAVRDIEVGLRVVGEHLPIPGEGVHATEEASVEDGQFPVLAIVDLACSRQYQAQPHCPNRVGFEVLEVAMRPYILQYVVADGKQCGGIDSVFCEHTIHFLCLKYRCEAEPEGQGHEDEESVPEFHLVA